MILSHRFDDNSIGPIGRADAELLGSIAGYYHKPRVLEIGSQFGDSAALWIGAGCSRLICVDSNITDDLRDTVYLCDFAYLVQTNQQEFLTTEIFDIIFLDASHDLKLNVATIQNLQGNLAPGGTLILHDTGIWARAHMTDEHKAFPYGYDLPEGKMHQPGEVLTVQWLKANGWNCVSLASRNALRHGITICQK
jgi:predicted O-methyltransferase YrrM